MPRAWQVLSGSQHSPRDRDPLSHGLAGDHRSPTALLHPTATRVLTRALPGAEKFPAPRLGPSSQGASCRKPLRVSPSPARKLHLLRGRTAHRGRGLQRLSTAPKPRDPGAPLFPRLWRPAPQRHHPKAPAPSPPAAPAASGTPAHLDRLLREALTETPAVPSPTRPRTLVTYSRERWRVCTGLRHLGPNPAAKRPSLGLISAPIAGGG